MSTHGLERRVERSHNMVIVNKSVVLKTGKQNHMNSWAIIMVDQLSHEQ